MHGDATLPQRSDASVQLREVRATARGGALHEVSMHVAAGESVAIVGAHQPSLSLVVRVCGGFEQVEGGELEVAGIDLRRADRLQLAALRRRLGYVSIRGGLISNLTLRGNLELALRYRGWPAADAVALVDERLARVGLEVVADQRTSVAEAELQKCFAYLRALLFEPQVLMTEDPSAFLHPAGREIVAGLHAEARARGITVLVADDDEAFVTPLVDRVVSLAEISAPAEERGPQ